MQVKIVHYCGMEHKLFFRVRLIPDGKRSFFWNNKSPIEYFLLVTPKFMPPTTRNIFHQKKVKMQKKLTKTNTPVLMQLNCDWPRITQLISSVDLSWWVTTGNIFCKTMWPWIVRGSQANASCIQITDNYAGLMEMFRPSPLPFSIYWLCVVLLFCLLDSLIKNETQTSMY